MDRFFKFFTLTCVCLMHSLFFDIGYRYRCETSEKRVRQPLLEYYNLKRLEGVLFKDVVSKTVPEIWINNLNISIYIYCFRYPHLSNKNRFLQMISREPAMDARCSDVGWWLALSTSNPKSQGCM